ncbi:MAG: D-alanyl-D-alanine carboxypeptidase [Steroidobacteraceae bacterium]
MHVEERAPARAMSPASTMKLVTTWAALNRLGPARSAGAPRRW